MAFNQLTKYEKGYATPDGNTGKIVLGTNDLFNGKGDFVGGSEGLCGIAIDPSGNIYCSDSKKHIIIVTTPSGKVSTYAGKAGVWGNNGTSVVTAYDARFKDPRGLACDSSGNLYVADTGNNQIRKIDSNRNVSLVAGDPYGLPGFVDGYVWQPCYIPAEGSSSSSSALGELAKFRSPYDVAVDCAGNVWVTVQTHKNIAAAANLVDVSAVIIVRGKKVPEDTILMADRAKLTLFTTDLDTFQVAVKLYEAGVRPTI